jgi:D-glycero-alpha-D-manno-heptose 1-phosphate guanylyltransferase
MNSLSPQTTATMSTGLTAIILAGGLGTRLRSVVADLPKCLAPVAGRPFLAHVIDHLKHCGVQSFLVAGGYKHELLGRFIAETYPDLSIRMEVEEELLGTGGAIYRCCNRTEHPRVLVVNGDTLFQFKPQPLLDLHFNRDADCTLCLKPLQHFDRYGSVELNPEARIARFREKAYCESGFINAGVYLLQREAFLSMRFPQRFSFEQDYLSAYAGEKKFFGNIQDEYFIDIGIPEDYVKANRELTTTT